MKDMKWFEDMEKRIPTGEVRTRFAPSPTGYMHVGNLRTALYTYLIARHNKGKFILRIEDTDQGRLVEGAVDVIYRTMEQCHLEHDEGPDVGGPVGPYVQTERRGLYKEYAELLMERGHAYRCFCEKTASEEDTGEFDRGDDPCRCMSREESDRLAAEGNEQIARGGLRPCVRLRIVYYIPGFPGNYYPVIALNVEKAQHLGNALLIGIVKARKSGGKRCGLALHRLFFLLKHGVARGDERIDIQQQEQDQQQHRQKREKLKADAAGSECPAFNLQSNTPLPTW